MVDVFEGIGGFNPDGDEEIRKGRFGSGLFVWKISPSARAVVGCWSIQRSPCPPGGGRFFVGAKKGRKKAPYQLGRLVIGGKKLITARSFWNRVLPLRSSAIPNKTLPLRAVSF
ncbi:hypothetical protein [uncultured Pseudodesulfovibrio sp.]|uniref:hypothetical protein n=1 Tax=uncultured Pseudodesulfovibrio sp. TaxID=2035858 RepID=UPI00374962C3